jgi:hypothetical protein
MAYTPGQPFSYGIPDGKYRGKPTTASCFEKDGKLILDINFAVIDPQTGETYKKDNGYEWEAKKRHWLTNKDGGFNEATINGIKEWAPGWAPATFADFWWFQNPDANGVPFGNLKAIGEVELNFQIDKTGNQQLWVHALNRAKGSRSAYVPEGGLSDVAQLQAKWGAKAKALFAAQPKKVGAAPQAVATAPGAIAAPSAPSAAPARPAPAPARPTFAKATVGEPAAPEEKPWASFPQTSDGAFAYYCSLLGEPYKSEKHDEKWFETYDSVANGKDPDELTPADVQALFKAVSAVDMPF